jgi:hypothetical protein
MVTVPAAGSTVKVLLGVVARRAPDGVKLGATFKPDNVNAELPEAEPIPVTA